MLRNSLRRWQLFGSCAVLIAIWTIIITLGCHADNSVSDPTPVGGGNTPGKKPFDPILVNGKYFDGWEEPGLVIVATGDLAGYMEPCGCAGIDLQAGGLARRFSLLKQLEAKGWPILRVDAGGLINEKRPLPQAQIQMEMTVKALQMMNYKAIGLGKPDLRLPSEKLLEFAFNYPEKGTNEVPLFVTGNYQLDNPEFRWTYKVVEVGKYKIFITNVLGSAYQQGLGNEFAYVSPAKALAKIVKLKEFAQCNMHVLLGYLPRDAKDPKEETLKTLLELPPFKDKFEVAVAALRGFASGASINAGKTVIVDCDYKGAHAAAVGFFNDKTRPVRIQDVTIDSRFPDAPEILAIKQEYQDRVVSEYKLWLANEFKGGLSLPMSPHPKADKMGKFVGAAECKACHEGEFKIWKESGHAKATETLLTGTKPPRQFDPECIACHATGWDPEEERFNPFKTGYLSPEKTPHLLGNQCENCHGPGENHVAAEKPGSAVAAKDRDELRKLVKGQLDVKTCIKCHDGDNSPEFKFDEFWKKIEH